MGVQINGDTGNISATKADYSGNVTIGGTLTYEDVTNIDSVGLVTARNGIEIGARPGVAASISVDGNMIVSGISTFGGDVHVADKIIHTGDTDTAIRFPSGNVISFETNGDEELRIDGGGRILYGKTTNRQSRLGSNNFSPNIQIEDQDVGAAALTRFNDNVSPFRLVLQKGRGTIASPAIVQDDDIAGQILFSAHDGSNFCNTAKIDSEIDGPVGVNSMPGKLSFQTSSAGNQNPTERFSINSAGISTFFENVTIDARGSSNTVSSNLYLRAGNSGSSQIYMIADRGDDNGDIWRIAAMSGFSNRMIFFNSASGSATDVFSIATNGSIRPGTTNQADLGSSDYRWANLYTQDLQLSNEASGGNKVDGTWGDYTIQEGETDLYLINNRSGKKYKFNLTEVS